MSERYKFFEKESLYFVSPTIVGWVDLFTKKQYTKIILNSLMFCQKEKGLIIFAFVIMKNHIHLVAQASENNLSDIIRDFKKYTSRMITSILISSEEAKPKWMVEQFSQYGAQCRNNETYQFWKQDNHPIELYSNKFFKQKIKYIHNNPIKAGIVENPEDYLYSSARNYADLESVIDIVKVDLY